MNNLDLNVRALLISTLAAIQSFKRTHYPVNPAGNQPAHVWRPFCENRMEDIKAQLEKAEKAIGKFLKPKKVRAK